MEEVKASARRAEQDRQRELSDAEERQARKAGGRLRRRAPERCGQRLVTRVWRDVSNIMSVAEEDARQVALLKEQEGALRRRLADRTSECDAALRERDDLRSEIR